MPSIFNFPEPIGINPNAPPPLSRAQRPVLKMPATQGGGGGLGLGSILRGIFGGQQGQQPQSAPGGPPTGLGDLPPLQKALLALGDVAAGYQGQVGPSQQLLAQRRAQYEQKRQAYLQNLALLDKFGEALQNTPVDQIEARKAKLREAYEQIAPGGGEMFDSVLGDTGLSKATLEQLAEDEGAKVILAQGGTMKDILDYRKSPDFVNRTVERADTKSLPAVQKKVQGLLNSKDPAVRAELAKIVKDGSVTAAEVEALSSQFGTDGPEGTRLSEAEAQTLRRQQAKIAQLIPGFTTDAVFNQKAESKRAEADYRAKKAIDQEYAATEEGLAPSERKDLRKARPQVIAGITTAKQKVAKLKKAKELYESLSVTGFGSGAFGASDAREDLRSLIAEIRVTAVPKGQGQVSNYERSIFNEAIPADESDASAEVYDRLIAGYEAAIADDEATLSEYDALLPRAAGEAQPKQRGGAEGSWDDESAPGIETRRTKDGRTVKVRKLPDGTYELVE